MDYFIKLVFSFLLLFSGFAFAATPFDLAIPFRASSISNVVKSPFQTLLASTTSVRYEAKTASGLRVYASRAVPVSKVALGKIAKRLVFGPWGLALSLALEASGFNVDQPSGTISTSGGSFSSTDVGNCVCRSTTGALLWSAFTPYDICQSAFNQCDAGFLTFVPNDVLNPSFVIGVDSNPDYSSSTDASSTQIADSILPTLSSSLLKDLLVDPLTGLPNSRSQVSPTPSNTATLDDDPFQSVADELTTDYEDKVLADPLSNPTLDFSLPPSESFSSEPFSNDNVPVVVEVPDPCIENPDRIGCSTFGDISAVPIPIITPSFDYQPIVLSGSATCPQSETMQLKKGTFVMSNQPLCDFAVGVSPIVIALCSFLAIYILVGGVRNA